MSDVRWPDSGKVCADGEARLVTGPFRVQVSDGHTAYGAVNGPVTAPHRPPITGRAVVEVALTVLSVTPDAALEAVGQRL